MGGNTADRFLIRSKCIYYIGIIFLYSLLGTPETELQGLGRLGVQGIGTLETFETLHGGHPPSRISIYKGKGRQP